MKSTSHQPYSLALATAAALLLTPALLPSAQADLFRASAAETTEFVENADIATVDYSRRVPFHTYWRNPSAAAWNSVEGFDKITIAPVEISHLRNRTDAFARSEKDEEAAIRLAAYAQNQFEKQIARSGVYTVVRGNGPSTLVVELALVELNPSNTPGNVLKTGASVVVPGAGLAGGLFTKGRIAIEGKVRNGETGELLVEFTDSARDKTTAFSFRDFSPYAHSRAAINDWAKQFDALTRTPRTHPIRGSLALGLNPF